MIAGFGICLFYLIMTQYYPQTFIHWFGSAETVTALDAILSKVAEATAATAAAGDAATPEMKTALGAAQTELKNFLTAKATWWGVKNISCGLFGIPVAFLVTWLVSLVTRAPSREMQDFIDSIRVPRGAVATLKHQAAVE
jgi:cation/acetate symporter